VDVKDLNFARQLEMIDEIAELARKLGLEDVEKAA